jgi:hypothetical protein
MMMSALSSTPSAYSIRPGLRESFVERQVPVSSGISDVVGKVVDAWVDTRRKLALLNYGFAASHSVHVDRFGENCTGVRSAALL